MAKPSDAEPYTAYLPQQDWGQGWGLGKGVGLGLGLGLT